jgi:hypothetical protein
MRQQLTAMLIDSTTAAIDRSKYRDDTAAPPSRQGRRGGPPPGFPSTSARGCRSGPTASTAGRRPGRNLPTRGCRWTDSLWHPFLRGYLAPKGVEVRGLGKIVSAAPMRGHSASPQGFGLQDSKRLGAQGRPRARRADPRKRQGRATAGFPWQEPRPSTPFPLRPQGKV